MNKVLVGLFLIVSMAGLTPAFAGLEVEDLGKQYSPDKSRVPEWLQYHIEKDNDVAGGNTSFRNTSAEYLEWKGSPNGNGYGYFQRNRDLGQVFNVPEGESIKMDAIILRTAKGNNAMMKGSPGAPVYVQLFEVVTKPGEQLRINDNGTPVGTLSRHGYDLEHSRTDDFVEGVEYVPIARSGVGRIPESMPYTTQYVYNRGDGKPFGEQPGHLRYMRWDLTGTDEWVLEGGKRYAFIVGFEQPGKDRGIGLANTSMAYLARDPDFLEDKNGLEYWCIRREGDGTLPPTMIGASDPPADLKMRTRLMKESLFSKNHWETLSPTSDGYPDIDSYRVYQFYIEIH